MIKKILVILTTVIISIVLFCGSSLADVGNFNDYDSSGGWDSGGGYDFNYDYDSDYDSYDDDDDNYYYGSSGGGYRGGSGGGSSFGFFDIVLFVIIMLIVLTVAKKNSSSVRTAKTNKNIKPQATNNNIILQDNTSIIKSAITKIDPEFSYVKFLSWSKEVFVTLQEAWYAREWDRIRPFEKEELYKQHEKQIKEYIERGWVNVLERININNAYLYRYERDKEYEYLSVFIQARMTDYIKDENTGSVIKGNPEIDSYGKYLYTFMRKKGVLTSSVKAQNSIVECPNCGAPTNITSAGKCEYCGFIVTTGEYSWVLSDIEGVKSYSSVKEGGVFINE